MVQNQEQASLSGMEFPAVLSDEYLILLPLGFQSDFSPSIAHTLWNVHGWKENILYMVVLTISGIVELYLLQ